MPRHRRCPAARPARRQASPRHTATITQRIASGRVKASHPPRYAPCPCPRLCWVPLILLLSDPIPHAAEHPLRRAAPRPGHFALSVVQEGGQLDHMLVLPSYAGKDANAPGATRYRLGTYSKMLFNTVPKLCAYVTHAPASPSFTNTHTHTHTHTHTRTHTRTRTRRGGGHRGGGALL